MHNTLKTHDLIYFVCVCVLAFGDDNSCGSLATQIFCNFIMQDFFFFSVHLYYMDEKENAKIKELVHLADLVGLHVLLALGRSACVGVLFTG